MSYILFFIDFDADDFLWCDLLKENACNFIQISLQSVPMGANYHKSALIQVMAWRYAGDKPLLAPMLTQLTDACLYH